MESSLAGQRHIAQCEWPSNTAISFAAATAADNWPAFDAPAENVTFFNVGLLNSRLSALQERLNQLEKELAEAKGRK